MIVIYDNTVLGTSVATYPECNARVENFDRRAVTRLATGIYTHLDLVSIQLIYR